MTLDSTIWLGSTLGEVAVLGFILYRKIWKVLPIFSIYLAFVLVSDFLYLEFIRKYPQSYVSAYTVQMTVDSLFQFAVLVELAWSVLRPVKKSLPRSSILIVIALILVAGGIIWPIAGMTMPPNLLAGMSVPFHLLQTFAILRVICFLVMASFSQLLAIGWRDRELQVATGLGIYSIVSLIVAVMETHHRSTQEMAWLNRAVTIGYLCTLFYWVLSFAAKQMERKEFSPQMQQVLVLMGGGARTGRVALSNLSSQNRRQKDK